MPRSWLVEGPEPIARRWPWHTDSPEDIMVKTHAGRALAAEDCISILSNAMTDEMWQFIRKEGKLFDYKYHLGRDVDAMERAEPFMLAVLEIEPTGIFIKTPMIKALENWRKVRPRSWRKALPGHKPQTSINCLWTCVPFGRIALSGPDCLAMWFAFSTSPRVTMDRNWHVCND